MNERQFAERYGLVYRDLYRFALSMMGSAVEAEDVLGEAVLAAWEKRAQLRREEAFKSWLFQIAANACRRRLRQAQRTQPAEDATFERPEDGALDAAEALAVREAFAQLCEEDRLIVGLAVFGGYRSREIGALLTMNPSTVRSRRKRALERMAAFLGGVN